MYRESYLPDLVRDPIGTLGFLYEAWGRPLTAEAQVAMETWLRNNPSDKGGTRKYTGEQFGLERRAA